jgi:hypothetical protein
LSQQRYEAARAHALKKWLDSLGTSGSESLADEQRGTNIDSPAVTPGAISLASSASSTQAKNAKSEDCRTEAVLPVVEPSSPSLPPAFRQHPPSNNRRQSWVWLAGAIVFGALAYVSVSTPRRSSQHTAPVAVPAEKQLRTPGTATANPEEKVAVLSQAPAEDSADRLQAKVRQDSRDTEIRNFLENWAEAAKAGDIKRGTNMYAERLSTFFTKRNATRADVHRARKLNLARYGRMSVYRISDIQISPIRNNQVTVTLRKMWQSSGPRISSGEEKEQLTLVRHAAEWRIVAEKEIEVYWVKKDRGGP